MTKKICDVCEMANAEIKNEAVLIGFANGKPIFICQECKDRVFPDEKDWDKLNETM